MNTKEIVETAISNASESFDLLKKISKLKTSFNDLNISNEKISEIICQTYWEAFNAAHLNKNCAGVYLVAWPSISEIKSVYIGQSENIEKRAYGLKSTHGFFSSENHIILVKENSIHKRKEIESKIICYFLQNTDIVVKNKVFSYFNEKVA